MAVVAHTNVTDRLPVGQYVMQTYETSALGTGAADEWIATGLTSIIAVVGCAVLGTTTSTTSVAFEINAQGTGVAEDTNHGDLGIEVTDAGINQVQVTVIGIP